MLQDVPIVLLPKLLDQILIYPSLTSLRHMGQLSECINYKIDNYKDTSKHDIL